MSIAVVDACFLINWSRFRYREDLFKLYPRLALPEIVLSEIRSSDAKRFMLSLATSGKLIIIPRVNLIDREALKLFTLINSIPELPRIDEPEAYGLAYAKLHGIPFLTDNAAPRIAREFLREIREVQVLDSLEVLCRLYSGEYLLLRIKEFMRDTGIVFSKKRLREKRIEYEE